MFGFETENVIIGAAQNFGQLLDVLTAGQGLPGFPCGYGRRLNAHQRRHLTLLEAHCLPQPFNCHRFSSFLWDMQQFPEGVKIV